jgi:hypothetical protein
MAAVNTEKRWSAREKMYTTDVEFVLLTVVTHQKVQIKSRIILRAFFPNLKELKAQSLALSVDHDYQYSQLDILCNIPALLFYERAAFFHVLLF